MLVTVGIPFYNNGKTLADAIQSVFAQTFTDWQLILADDGSSDGSLEIAGAVSDPRVRVISDGTNRGLPYRLNLISKLAAGKYVARMDADDLMHPDRLKIQAEFLDSHPKVDVVGTGAVTIDVDGAPRGIRGMGRMDTRPASVFSDGLLLHPTIMGRTKWFMSNKYDEGFFGAEDHELWCRTLSCTAHGKIIAPLHFYRENARAPEEYLDHYLKALCCQRKLLAMYGSRLIGKQRTRSLSVNTRVKEMIYRFATLVGMQHHLIRRRNAPLSQAQVVEALWQMDVIRQTTVPGFHRLKDRVTVQRMED